MIVHVGGVIDDRRRSLTPLGVQHVVLESFRFLDEDDYEYEIVSHNNSERAQTNIILDGKTWYCRQFSTRFCKKSCRVKTSQVLAFSDRQKGSVSSKENNWVTYTVFNE